MENFARTGDANDEQVTVVKLPKRKSSTIENDRSVMLKEDKVNEKLI